ncbi:MAG: SH3 domain-containing protein [Anaerolineae bacterium]|nr:SH3 domain-containing protein [Anaerolineae bacterium]
MKRASALILVVLALVAAALLAPITAQADFGTNWTATYYNCTDFNCPAVATQTGVNGINFNWGTSSPFQGVNSDNFTVRFESVQTFQQGTYEFVAASDDGIRVYIDGALVLDKFIGRVFTTDRFQQTLTAGAHTLRVEFLELIDQAQVQFQYFFVSGSPIGVPTTSIGQILGTPIAPGTPTGPLATVTGVRGLAVRTGPYLGASFVTTAQGDTGYSVLARNRSEGVYTWYLIQVGERQGWASGRYLTISGVDPNALPERGSVFDEVGNAPDIGITGIPRSVMNLRVRPSVRTQRLDQIAWGEEVSIIGRTIQARQNFWLQVRTQEGQVGWIYAPYVTIHGEINAAPIR